MARIHKNLQMPSCLLPSLCDSPGQEKKKAMKAQNVIGHGWDVCFRSILLNLYKHNPSYNGRLPAARWLEAQSSVEVEVEGRLD